MKPSSFVTFLRYSVPLWCVFGIYGCDNTDTSNEKPGAKRDASVSASERDGGKHPSKPSKPAKDPDPSGEQTSDVEAEAGETSKAEPAHDSGDSTDASQDEIDGGANETPTTEGPTPGEPGDPHPVAEGKTGIVVVQQTIQTVAGATLVSGMGSAEFGAAASVASSGGVSSTLDAFETVCNTLRMGSCLLIDLDSCDDTSSSSSQETVFLDAGEVTVLGLSLQPTFNFDSETGQYLTDPYTSIGGEGLGDAMPLWTGGELATAQVGGSDLVPAVDVELNLPTSLTVTSPLPDEQLQYEISSTLNLEIKWETSPIIPAGQIWLTLAYGSDPNNQMVVCEGDAASGSLIVDASLLSEASGEGALSLSVRALKSISVDDWNFSFLATTVPLTGTVSFQ
ncbi:MAG TPA: hypothetical protein VHM70_28140 [Polyangiaceae bacterium]|jgi:hypothetical protein|nr:hypothetical protein [Polyangiaceae bacterium]